jgi:hypothetical protein
VKTFPARLGRASLVAMGAVLAPRLVSRRHVDLKRTCSAVCPQG